MSFGIRTFDSSGQPRLTENSFAAKFYGYYTGAVYSWGANSVWVPIPGFSAAAGDLVIHAFPTDLSWIVAGEGGATVMFLSDRPSASMSASFFAVKR